MHSCVRAYGKSAGYTDKQMIGLAFVHMLAWIIILQVVTCILSGAWRTVLGLEEQMRRKQRKIDVVCWCGMLAHVSGFASIQVCILLQHHGWFSLTPLHALSVAPLVMFGLWLMFFSSHLIRKFCIRTNKAVNEEGSDLWDWKTEDAENDIIALTLSFVFTNTYQFYLLGSLPEGEELMSASLSRPASLHSAYGMAGGSLALALVVFATVVIVENIRDRLHRTFVRQAEILIEISSMSLVWMLLSMWRGAVLYCHPDVKLESVLTKIRHALFLTIVCFAVTILLDKIADMFRGCNEHDAMVKVILSLGMLVGFSWEQAFFGAVEEIMLTPLKRLAFTILLCTIVVPAYWKFIQPKIHEVRDENKRERKRETSGLDRTSSK